MSVLVTERLVLRRAEAGDLAGLHGVFSDPRAMRYWDSPPFGDVAQTARLLEEMMRAEPPDSDDFVVTRDGAVIGKAGCWRRGEIGVILHPDHWGEGLAREALAAAIPHGFETWPEMAQLVADVDPRNTGSLRLLEGLGFRETGRAERTILVGTEWCDSVYLELRRGGMKSA